MPQEYTILIGLCIQTVIYLLAGYRIFVQTEVSANILKEEVKEMKTELEKLASVIVTQAIQTTRLDNLLTMVTSIEKRVEDLRRGDGYIQARSKGAVDREY